MILRDGLAVFEAKDICRKLETDKIDFKVDQVSGEEAAMQPKGGVCNFMIRVKNGNLSEKACAYWDEDARDYALAMMKRYRA